jgi:hypothetical protein
LDGEDNARHAGDEAIADQRFFRQLCHAVDEVGVNLAQGDEGPRLVTARGTELLQESRSIAFDQTARVLLGESEIESVAAINAGEPAESGAESMNQPWNASEGFRTKDGQSSFVRTLGGHQNILTIKATAPGKMRDLQAFLRV